MAGYNRQGINSIIANPQTAQPISAFIQGRAARMAFEQDERRGRLFDMQIQQAQQEMAMRPKMLEAQMRQQQLAYEKLQYDMQLATNRERRDVAKEERAAAIEPLRREETQTRIESNRANAANARAAPAREMRAAQRAVTKSLNDVYRNEMASPVKIQDAVQQIDFAVDSGDSLGALAAIVKMAKILDPESVVREGEVVTVEKGMGVIRGLVNEYNKMMARGFTPETAEAFRRTAYGLARPLMERGASIYEQITNAATMQGIPPSQVGGTVTMGKGWDVDYADNFLATGQQGQGQGGLPPPPGPGWTVEQY